MKTIIFLILNVILFTSVTHGQVIRKPFRIDRGMESDTVKSLPEYLQKQRPEIFQDIIADTFTIVQGPGSRSARMFPGSDRYYARRPELNPFQYKGSFVRTPHDSAKLYLIIKDPISGTIIR
jgi:hypothetical protein